MLCTTQITIKSCLLCTKMVKNQVDMFFKFAPGVFFILKCAQAQDGCELYCLCDNRFMYCNDFPVLPLLSKRLSLKILHLLTLFKVFHE